MDISTWNRNLQKFSDILRLLNTHFYWTSFILEKPSSSNWIIKTLTEARTIAVISRQSN